jgi:hypothetical protein
MSDKAALIALLAAMIALAYPFGCLVAKFAESRRWLARAVGLAGLILFLVTLGVPDGDRRIVVLAGLGLFLQAAWLVSSFKMKRTFRAQHLELWAPPREPGQ